MTLPEGNYTKEELVAFKVIFLVFDEIARQFNVTIVKNLPDRHYTGYFNKSVLKEAFDHVCLPMGLTWVTGR
jgi:hypothetical protein